jgi:hypothetical protein
MLVAVSQGYSPDVGIATGIVEVNRLFSISTEVVETARDSLVIGQA